MQTLARYSIDPVDLHGLPEPELAELARLRQVLEREWVPEDPPTPVDTLVRRWRPRVDSQWRTDFTARDADGTLVGSASVVGERHDPPNAHLCWSYVGVEPTHRRRSVGRALLTRLVASAGEQAGTTREPLLVGGTSDRVPAGAAFLGAVGATPGLAKRVSQLDLAMVDRAQVAAWAALDPAGYRLERVGDVLPPHLVAPYIEAANAMNDAPHGDIAFGDWRETEERVREREAWRLEAGLRTRLAIAIHKPSGAGAGFTAVAYDPRVPHLVRQMGTGVVQAHRGHALGLWMKAVVLQGLIEEWPQAKFVRTDNAHVNEHMLAINTQLGYRYAWTEVLWQLPLAEARRSTR